MSKTLLKIVAYKNQLGHHVSKHLILIDWKTPSSVPLLNIRMVEALQ